MVVVIFILVIAVVLLIVLLFQKNNFVYTTGKIVSKVKQYEGISQIVYYYFFVEYKTQTQTLIEKIKVDRVTFGSYNEQDTITICSTESELEN